MNTNEKQKIKHNFLKSELKVVDSNWEEEEIVIKLRMSQLSTEEASKIGMGLSELDSKLAAYNSITEPQSPVWSPVYGVFLLVTGVVVLYFLLKPGGQLTTEGKMPYLMGCILCIGLAIFIIQRYFKRRRERQE